MMPSLLNPITGYIGPLNSEADRSVVVTTE